MSNKPTNDQIAATKAPTTLEAARQPSFIPDDYPQIQNIMEAKPVSVKVEIDTDRNFVVGATRDGQFVVMARDSHDGARWTQNILEAMLFVNTNEAMFTFRKYARVLMHSSILQIDTPVDENSIAVFMLILDKITPIAYCEDNPEIPDIREYIEEINDIIFETFGTTKEYILSQIPSITAQTKEELKTMKKFPGSSDIENAKAAMRHALLQTLLAADAGRETPPQQ